MKNLEIAKIFYEIADMLELQEVQFKPRAYRNAAQSIESLSEPIEEIAKQNKLKEIPGVGEAIAKKIEELIRTGKLAYFEELKQSFPFDIEGLSAVEGLGPKKAKRLYDALGIKNLEELEQAAKAGKIREIAGFGVASEKNIFAGIAIAKKGKERMLLGSAIIIAREIAIKMKTIQGVDRVEIVGSLARRKETIGDIDILVISSYPKNAMDFFCSMPDVARVIAKGETKSAIELSSGLHVDLRVFEKNSFGAAMQYFIGSKEHNVAVRRIAISKGMKLSEYGLFRGETQVAGRDEREIYEKLGMGWIAPELRENQGEIEAAQKGKLPELIMLSDIRGDLHIHTNWSEGKNTIEEMAEKGKLIGYEYMIISDHAGKLPVANAMDEKKIRKQMEEIDKINKTLDRRDGSFPFLLKGAEVNILQKGKGSGVDVPDSVLKDLDIVNAAIHNRMHGKLEENMARLFSAMENEHVDIISHPTGRLVNKREQYALDMDALIDKAKETGTMLEINAQPDRLDLNDENVRKAVKAGVMLAISTDAHSVSQMDYMELGISTARRGWCEKKNVINTMGLEEIRRKIGI